MRSVVVPVLAVSAAVQQEVQPTDCTKQASDLSKCHKFPACEGNCQHPWCAVPPDANCVECGEQWHKCKWPNAECEAAGGCLDYSEALKDCDENCNGPHCKVCLFTTKDALDETRQVEAALMDANANYELIFDHPDYPLASLPKVVPADPKFWHKKPCSPSDPSCHTPVGPTYCAGQDSGKSDDTWFFLASEFRTCREAYEAATRYSQAKYGEIHIPAVPMADNDPLCTDLVDPDVAWEFGNTKYASCLDALRAAQAAEKADNPDYSCSA